MQRGTLAIVELADRLVADINARGLAPGDSYLSAAEAAKVLRTSTIAANRALQLLEHRQILIRRQRKGAVIAAPRTEQNPQVIRRVNLVVAQNYFHVEGLLADGVVAGIQSVLPSADFQFRFISEVDEKDAVERIMGEAIRSNEREAFVLVRTAHRVQQAIAASSMPTVIYGMPYVTKTPIAYIDRDNFATGTLLTNYLLDQGAGQCLVLVRPVVYAGDNVLFDGVRQAFIDRKLSCNQLFVRGLPADADVIHEMILHLLQNGKEKLGILCRAVPHAEAADAAVQRLGRTDRKRIAGMAVADVYHASTEKAAWPTADLTMTPEDVGQQIGRMLQAQAEGRTPEPPHLLIPVALRIS